MKKERKVCHKRKEKYNKENRHKLFLPLLKAYNLKEIEICSKSK